MKVLPLWYKTLYMHRSYRHITYIPSTFVFSYFIQDKLL